MTGRDSGADAGGAALIAGQTCAHGGFADGAQILSAKTRHVAVHGDFFLHRARAWVCEQLPHVESHHEAQQYCWQVAGELAEPYAASMLLDGPQMYGRGAHGASWRAGMVYPDGEGPDQHRSAANAETHAHSTHTHVLRLQAHTLARSLARATGRPAATSRADRERAGGPGEWGYDYNDSRDDELRRLPRRCGGCDLKRLLECKTTF